MGNIKFRFPDIFGADSDFQFLEIYKSDWNRFCNAYKPRKRTFSKEELKPAQWEENALPILVDLGKKYGRLYEIYLKYKFIPDNRFFISTDEEFAKTLHKMHEILSTNLYPESKDNDPDLAYDVRWRAVVLIEYLKSLTQDKWRLVGLAVFRFTVFVSVPVLIFLEIINKISDLII